MCERNMVPMETLIKSISMGPFGSDVKVEYMRDSGVPIIDGSNLTGIKMNWNSFRYLDQKHAEKLQSAIAHKGDIIVTHRGTLGQLSYVPDDIPFEEFLISQSQFRVSLDTSKINPIYFAYYFHTSEGQKRLLSFANYVGVPALASATTNFRALEFPLISLKEQDKIVGLLKRIDEKIENNSSVCSDLESMAKLLYDYWFVQFDFPDEHGRPYKSSGGKMVWNEELKREIPEGWKVAPFEKCIASINTGLNPRDNFQLNTGGKIRYLTVKNLTKEGTIDFTSCDMIDEDARAIVHRRSDIQVGDILFASISPLGRCHVITETPEDWDINESVFSIRPNYQNMTSIFLYMTFMSDVFIKKAEGSSAGSVFKGIRISELQGLNTILPPKAILNAFDEQTKNIFKMKAIAFAENHQLAALRDFLLPMLMNGQVKVADKTSEE